MFKKYLTRNWIIIECFVLVFLLIIGYFWFGRAGINQDSVKVVRSTISQEVVITGKTEAIENIQMSFDRSGRVASTPVRVGERVSSGQTLVSLDSGDLYAQLDQALANVKVQQAKLDELKKGARQEDVDVSNSQVLAAQSDLSDSLGSLLQSLTGAYTETDDAIRNLTDIFFDNPDTINALFNLSGVTSDELIDLSFTRRDLENRLIDWSKRTGVLTTKSDLDKEYTLDLEILYKTRVYLDKISKAVNPLTPDGTLTATILSGYRTNVSSARTEINSVISSLQSSKQAVLSAQNKLDLSMNQLRLKKAPPTKEELISGEAGVEQAQAQAEQIRAQISKNMIISPISGVVTRQDAKVGQTVSPGVNIVTVMSDGDFEITANVPEVDVGKLALGNKVSITLDSYSGEVWTGVVSYIEPAETIVDGVVNYKIKVNFDKNDSRLKSGLTANLTIETIRRDNVLILPQYAIIENDKGSFVEKSLGNNKTEEVAVKIGIRSQDGMVEIISGVNEGDKVQNVGLKKK